MRALLPSLVLLASLLALGCGAPAAAPATPAATSVEPVADVPAKPAAPDKVAVATGKDCAKAEAVCENGLCAITVKNGCADPITCNVAIAAVCKSTTETGEARARGRDTVAANASGKISVGASCQGGVVLTTEVKEMQCR